MNQQRDVRNFAAEIKSLGALNRNQSSINVQMLVDDLSLYPMTVWVPAQAVTGIEVGMSYGVTLARGKIKPSKAGEEETALDRDFYWDFVNWLETVPEAPSEAPSEPPTGVPTGAAPQEADATITSTPQASKPGMSRFEKDSAGKHNGVICYIAKDLVNMYPPKPAKGEILTRELIAAEVAWYHSALWKALEVPQIEEEETD
mgnify:CR=1 FL=1